jgi:Stress responsive A/B Barrel Domain
MMKRSVILAAVLAVAWMMSGRQATESTRAADTDDKEVVKKDTKAPYVHTVIFHLKKDAPKDAAEGLIADAHELLAKIPTVRELRVGRPAKKGTPELANKDFAVALVIFFDDYDGLKTYIDHPKHKKYVERNVKNLDDQKLYIYDFENQKK